MSTLVIDVSPPNPHPDPLDFLLTFTLIDQVAVEVAVEVEREPSVVHLTTTSTNSLQLYLQTFLPSATRPLSSLLDLIYLHLHAPTLLTHVSPTA